MREISILNIYFHRQLQAHKLNGVGLFSHLFRFILVHLILFIITTFKVNFAAALPSSTSASGEYRLDVEGRSMQGSTIFNQANQGTCYAYAAASYFEALIRRDFKQTYVPSPMALAYEYKNYLLSNIPAPQRTEKDYSLDAGIAVDVLKIGRNYGVCPRKSFNDSLLSPEMYDDAASTAQALYWPLEYLYGLAKKQITETDQLKKKWNATDPLVVNSEKEQTKTSEYIRDYVITNKVSLNFKPTVQQIQAKVRESTHPFYFIYGLMKSSCEGQNLKVSLPIIERKTVSFTNPVSLDGVFSHIKTELERKNLPVLVDYCTEVIKNRKFKRDRTVCPSHVSLIMGYKSYNQKRFYLIQNSWGSNCKGVPHCDPDTGRFWIEESDLYNSMLNYYITH